MAQKWEVKMAYKMMDEGKSNDEINKAVTARKFLFDNQAKYERLGYKFALAFPDEYVLMYREKDGAKVRIYENGTVEEY